MALMYSTSRLKAIAAKLPTRCCPLLWKRLTDFGVSKVKPTRRGCRAGIQRPSEFCTFSKTTSTSSERSIVAHVSDFFATSTSFGESNLHIEPEYLNIQNDTSLQSTDPLKYDSHNNTAIYTENASIPSQPRSEFGPSLLLANVMSLVPKIDEISCFVNEHKPDLISLTETWLRNDVNVNNILCLPGYNLIFRNRSRDNHGGVCLYSANSIKAKVLSQLHHPDLEVLWVYLRSSRLPRGIPCIVSGSIYHPPSADDNVMLDYLYTSLTTIEGLYPGCGILLSGDFNRLRVSRLLNQFKLKQLVRVPTRGDNILDLIITNMNTVYDQDQIERHPPFGLSDHCAVLLRPKTRGQHKCSRRTIMKRDMRPSKKQCFGRYLSSIDWSVLHQLDNCDSKLQLFLDFVMIGLDNIMPLRAVKLQVNDAQWIAPELKELISLRQRAFAQGNKAQFKHYRNLVNRLRKSCRSTYYNNKVANLKRSKPKQWWNDVKKLLV